MENHSFGDSSMMRTYLFQRRVSSSCGQMTKTNTLIHKHKYTIKQLSREAVHVVSNIERMTTQFTIISDVSNTQQSQLSKRSTIWWRVQMRAHMVSCKVSNTYHTSACGHLLSCLRGLRFGGERPLIVTDCKLPLSSGMAAKTGIKILPAKML